MFLHSRMALETVNEGELGNQHRLRFYMRAEPGLAFSFLSALLYLKRQIWLM